jgi:caa(3)-type oxidase subunit IV
MTQIERHQKHAEPHSVIPYVGVWVALLILTVVTFWVAKVNLGAWNLAVAMLIATAKASLVVWVFMHLREHAGANRLVFGTALVFVALLMVLALGDVFTRPIITRPMDNAFEVKAREGTFPEPPPSTPATPVVH